MSNESRRKTLDEIRQEIEAEFGPPPEPREEPAAPVLRETPRTPIEGLAAPVRHPMPPQTPPPPVHNEMPSSPPREHVRQRERLVDRLVAHPAAHGRDADEDVEIDIEPDPHRALRRRGYVIAGLIGCIVGQFVIFGLLTTRYWMGPPAPQLAAPTTTTPTARPNSAGASAPQATPADLSTPTQIPDSTTSVAQADTAAVSDKAAATAGTASDASAPLPPSNVGQARASLPTAGAETAAGARGALTSSPSPVEPAPIPAPVAVAPPVTPGPRAAISAPTPSTSPDLPRRLPEQAPRVSTAPTGRPGMSRSTDWVAAQAALRAALRDWLVGSGLGDVSVASDAVVILDADGRTARTNVPVRWGGSVVVREQRWERQRNGWRIVEDRQTEGAR